MESGFQMKMLENGDEGYQFGDCEELKLGMEVSSEAEAYELCNNYAYKKGFSIRKGHLRKDAQNNPRQREFLCSKEGFLRDEDLCEVKKVRRLETRTGCKAAFRFNVENGVWKISYTNPHHNHEFASPEERKFLRSGRNIPSVGAAIVGYRVDESSTPVKADPILEKECGSADSVGFTHKDYHSLLQSKKGEMMEARDVQNLVNYFKHKQIEDPNFFYSVKVDQFSRITDFFWRDGGSKLDYDCFGDVVCFDTTFQTNKYNLICAPFVGVNHHWKNVLFGCAFLLDKSVDSCIWLFKTFLESMGHKQPKTIFTDEDTAIANALASVLPETRHRLCSWNISKNATLQLASHYANPEFKKQVNICFHDCFTEDEFQAAWGNMIKAFSLESNSWLKMIYSLKEKWCPAFSLDTFSANIASGQRGESMNNIFHQISRTNGDLISFAHHYEEKTKEMRFKELEEDFHCRNATPCLTINSGVFKQAATEYTVRMYSFLENELMGIFGVRMTEVGTDGNECIYEATEEGYGRVYRIRFRYDCFTARVSCSCKLFESMGVLCRHALKVLDLKNFTSIPAQYIVKRWTKGAKKGIVVSTDFSKSPYKKAKSAQSSRLSALMHEGTNVFSLGSLCDSGTRIVKQKLAETMQLLEGDAETTNMVRNLRRADDSSVCAAVLDD
ncbi:putative transcription factor FAR family [Rosa chinensis]|uniref:Putative transcription factor FAR family n=1 Tax=Rosa chinensis TaxID=74649 RepID=A0A2P6RM94_ROSCH|nr:protein FAR1-RELATED SEQUENCE 5 [Rosa chinensis]PRQ47511.1 putative transcription factor FAR family [Rosa chinensis]